ncbi:hypothetical protein DFO73_10514 [Cytobacillus oceanisediminis]|jgi:hypothetical protein|uniref:Uncharacterized protein n=1 Tax=Cytobacillus oceanisediminis TaxID=665099 RepID=A0A2V2ZXR4_9BACI|nr:hypothetical protein [Cytobacillus oceanisediminis]PWW28779.1 hypothetical protein DFO73_10514 [Cytobacillus oceanisediminis]
MQIRRSTKQAALFFIIYFALLCSLIFAATALKPSLQKKQPTEITSAFKGNPNSGGKAGEKSC